MSKKSVNLSLLGLGLLIAVGCISVPAHAALAQFAAGSYNLGSDLSGGATPSPTTPCGTGGTDALVFTGSGVNNIGIHSYSCGLGFFEFGSRSSGENTYYVDGSASVIGDLPSGASGFGFFISPGQVGAFGGTAFGAGEYQEATLSIKLLIDGNSYLDDLFHTKIGAGGLIEDATHSSFGSLGSVSSSFNAGAGFASFTVFGGGYFVSLSPDVDHTISYVISSLANGRVTSPTACRGIGPQGGFEETGAAFGDGNGDGGPIGDGSFSAYCGAGAQSGDPFPPLARELPEPGSLALLSVALGLLSLPALQRRRKQALPI